METVLEPCQADGDTLMNRGPSLAVAWLCTGLRRRLTAFPEATCCGAALRAASIVALRTEVRLAPAWKRTTRRPLRLSRTIGAPHDSPATGSPRAIGSSIRLRWVDQAHRPGAFAEGRHRHPPSRALGLLRQDPRRRQRLPRGHVARSVHSTLLAGPLSFLTSADHATAFRRPARHLAFRRPQSSRRFANP